MFINLSGVILWLVFTLILTATEKSKNLVILDGISESSSGHNLNRPLFLAHNTTFVRMPRFTYVLECRGCEKGQYFGSALFRSA